MTTLAVVDNPLLPSNLQQRIQEAKTQNDALMLLMKELLQEGVDYGRVKGVKDPFLHQPGAQQLALVFHFAPKFIQTNSTIDFQKEPVFIAYEYKCELYHRDTGTWLGDGVGASNSYERKYRYRTDYDTGEKYDFEDPLDNQNTLVKMAKKRAYVDAVCNVTGASRLFASEEDLPDHMGQRSDSGKGAANPGDTLVPFGKHKGRPLKELSNQDIQWLLSKAKSDKFKADCEAVLKERSEQEAAANEKIDNETGQKIMAEYVNGNDAEIRKKSREVVLSYLTGKGLKELTDITQLKKSEGTELLQKLQKEVDTSKAVA